MSSNSKCKGDMIIWRKQIFWRIKSEISQVVTVWSECARWRRSALLGFIFRTISRVGDMRDMGANVVMTVAGSCCFPFSPLLPQFNFYPSMRGKFPPHCAQNRDHISIFALQRILGSQRDNNNFPN